MRRCCPVFATRARFSWAKTRPNPPATTRQDPATYCRHPAPLVCEADCRPPTSSRSSQFSNFHLRHFWNWRLRSPPSPAPKAWKRTLVPWRSVLPSSTNKPIAAGPPESKSNEAGSRALQPRNAVLQMAPYHPPSSGRRNKLRLDFNENTVGASPHVLDFIKRFLTAADLTIYPEYEHAVEELADHFRVAPEEMTLTNGTDEAIQLVVNTFVDDNDE